LKKKRTFVIIPVKRFENSKTRLSPILSAGERAQLAELMLQDTLAALAPLRLGDTVIVSSDGRAGEIAKKYGASFILEEKDGGVNAAVRIADEYCIRAGAEATIVVPEDLPFLNAHDIDAMHTMAEADARCIVICPSARYDGTNVLLRKPPSVIATHYDNDSYKMHLEAAKGAGIPAHVARFEKLMFDIDTPSDVAALLAKMKKKEEEDAGARATLEFLSRRVA
jgi:2-phospho-L-lactate guanylyltransferase